MSQNCYWAMISQLLRAYLSVVIGLVSPLGASISITLGNFTASLSNLADSSNSGATDGMFWGILIDTEGTGFDGFSIPIDTPVILNDGVELAPGKFFYSSNLPTTTIPAGLGAGSGIPSNAFGMEPYNSPQVQEGQAFAVVWFDLGVGLGSTVSVDTPFGILTREGLLLPSDGSDTSFTPLFADPDPIRPTDQTAKALIPASTTSSIVTVDPGGGNPTTQNIAYQFPVSVVNDDSGALTYTLWKSTDLANWSVATTTPDLVSDDGTTRVLQLVDPDPVGADVSGKRFLRLEITP